MKGHQQKILDALKSGKKLVIVQQQNAGRTVARRAFEEWKKNFAAAEIDELRTEGHQDTRRPLSTAHEAP